MKQYASRSVLLKAAIELWADGPTYDAVYAVMRAKLDVLAPYRDHSFAFRFWHVNHVIKEARQRQIVDSFEFMSTGSNGVARKDRPEASGARDWSTGVSPGA